MAASVSILPSQQLAVLNVARKRLKATMAAAVFFAALVIAAIGAEVNLRTLFSYFGNFVSYFDRILTLEDGARVWTNMGEWFWGWQKWLKLLGETILISCRDLDRCRSRFRAEFFRRPEYLTGVVAAFRRPPPPGICPYRSRHRVRADLRHRVRPWADGRRAGGRDPFHRRARKAVLGDR